MTGMMVSSARLVRATESMDPMLRLLQKLVRVAAMQMLHAWDLFTSSLEL